MTRTLFNNLTNILSFFLIKCPLSGRKAFCIDVSELPTEAVPESQKGATEAIAPPPKPLTFSQKIVKKMWLKS